MYDIIPRGFRSLIKDLRNRRPLVVDRGTKTKHSSTADEEYENITRNWLTDRNQVQDIIASLPGSLSTERRPLTSGI